MPPCTECGATLTSARAITCSTGCRQARSRRLRETAPVRACPSVPTSRPAGAALRGAFERSRWVDAGLLLDALEEREDERERARELRGAWGAAFSC